MNLTKELYFTTSTIVDWVDIFTRPSYRHIVIESLEYCQKEKGLIIHAWVLMSNHLHMLVSTEGDNTINEIIRDFKKFTNKKILKTLENDIHESRKEWMLNLFSHHTEHNTVKYHFWQEGNYVEQIQTTNFLIQKINYIHQNPVRAEIVVRPEDYLYSSAPNYAGDKGLLDVNIIHF